MYTSHSVGRGDFRRHTSTAGACLQPLQPCRRPECSSRLLFLQSLFSACMHAISFRTFAAPDHRSTILIGLLVPLMSDKEYPLAKAATMAVEHINNDSSLLDGSRLEFVFAETLCSAPAALAALSKLLEEGPLAAVIGPGCSVACEATGFLTAGRDLPQISYSCLSPALTDKDAYPTVTCDAWPLSRMIRLMRSHCSDPKWFAVCTGSFSADKVDPCCTRPHEVGGMEEMCNYK